MSSDQAVGIKTKLRTMERHRATGGGGGAHADQSLLLVRTLGRRVSQARMREEGLGDACLHGLKKRCARVWLDKEQYGSRFGRVCKGAVERKEKERWTEDSLRH